MKLLFILSIGLDKPGPSVHILVSLLKGLAEKGHEVSVILQGDGREGSLPRELLEAGVKFTPISAGQSGKNNFVMRYMRQLRYALDVSRALKGREADVVYVHSNTAQLAFVSAVRRRLKTAKIVLNVQDIFPENMIFAGIMSPKNPLSAVMGDMQHRAYRESDAIITLSPDMKLTLELAGAKNVKVIPLWSYGDAVAPVPDADNAVLAELGEAKDCFLCVYAGNIGSMQNVEVVLGAAEILKDERDIRFIIVGSGAKLASLLNIKREKSLDNAIFLPMQPPERATSVYSMADVNLITLKKGVIKTAFPSKTTTCCAVGRPIIACVDQDSVYAETIRGFDNCLSVACDDAQALSRAIKDIRASRAEYSVKAREYYAASLSQRAGIDMHEALFKRVSRGEENGDE